MSDNNVIKTVSAWPFVEIRKLLKDRKNLIKSKNRITFQTGYGPSGLPHIGTFGEVARTSMMINALRHLEKIDIDRLSKMALDDPSTNGNPKKLSLEDMKTMYEYSISGELFK